MRADRSVAMGVNYYEHHLGDYMRDAAHLSLLEEGAYRRLIDAYYVREKELPAERKDIYKLVRAMSGAERKAVDYVLATFFKTTDAGFWHKRCDSEVKRFRAKSETAKASANARWSHSERNANGHANGMRTHSERNANGMLSSLQTPIPSISLPQPLLREEGLSLREAGQNPRALGTNPRANGANPKAQSSNPRAVGTNPRSLRDQRKQEAVLAWKRLVNSDGTLGREDPRVLRGISAAGGWQRIRARSEGADDAKCRGAFVAAFLAQAPALEASA